MQVIIRTLLRLGFSVALLLCLAGTVSIAREEFVSGYAAALGWGLASFFLTLFIGRAPREWRSLDPKPKRSN